MKIIRVFPRRTNATPDDENVRVGVYPTLFDEADAVHISVAFTWDMKWAEAATRQWRQVAPVEVGGPAFNMPGGDFVPGMYMKRGYVITSRGCPNRCWFCAVPTREGGTIRELPVTDGHIVTDDNLLACSADHINKVFAMLERQKERPVFAGGLEARLLTREMARRLYALRPRSLFFAYDTPDDYDSLVSAGQYLREAGFKREWHNMNAYVLIGYKSDTFEKASLRMSNTWAAGFVPMAMLYRNDTGIVDAKWNRFKQQWINPIVRGVNLKVLDSLK